jgi:hypothetical protein
MMNTAALIATFVLFNGQNLDGWIKLSGDWQVADGAMVCRSAPAVIRSVYESDQYTLSFQFRHADKGTNRLFLHSKMTASGTALELLPQGAVSRPGTLANLEIPRDEWVQVKIEVKPDQIRAVSLREDGRQIVEAKWKNDPKDRGFLRFEATEPGLEIRNVSVSEPGFASLFDGKTLDGWDIVRPKDPGDPGWVVENGTIQCRPRKSGWLRSLRTYDNFILRLEYQLPPRGNSGVYVRAPIEGRVSRIGMEFQLLDDEAFKTRIKRSQLTGSVYDGIAPEVSVPCPVNQWNAIEIMADGQHVRATLNGIQLYDALTTDRKKDTNADKRPLATRRTVGFIGLQDHAAPVKFRSIRIKELPHLTTGPGPKSE